MKVVELKPEIRVKLEEVWTDLAERYAAGEITELAAAWIDPSGDVYCSWAGREFLLLGAVSRLQHIIAAEMGE